jgi:hypothetical protein
MIPTASMLYLLFGPLFVDPALLDMSEAESAEEMQAILDGNKWNEDTLTLIRRAGRTLELMPIWWESWGEIPTYLEMAKAYRDRVAINGELFGLLDEFNAVIELMEREYTRTGW